MKPRRTHVSNRVFRLIGGTEDSDLWVQMAYDGDGDPIICSVWEPTADERQRIAGGENVQLVVWGLGHPPVAMALTDQPLGAAPRESA